MSESGVCVVTAVIKPIGARIDLKIAFPTTRPAAWIRGEVRWIRDAPAGSEVPLSMGIEFKVISEEMRAAIRESLAEDHAEDEATP